MRKNGAADGALEGKRILLVEDESLIAIVIEEMLEELGCELAGRAADLGSAVAAAEAGGFDGAVLDVNLDGLESFAVADALAARGVPFLFSTGYGEPRMPEPFADRPVLQKPFQEDELRDGLERLFRDG